MWAGGYGLVLHSVSGVRVWKRLCEIRGVQGQGLCRGGMTFEDFTICSSTAPKRKGCVRAGGSWRVGLHRGGI